MSSTKTSDLIVVSGLPRSGTSLLMSMLAAGGLPVLYDSERTADQHNPRGYFEYSRVINSGDDYTWLDQHKGKAVKILYRQLQSLPRDLSMRIILMERDLNEIIASQQKMLTNTDHAKPILGQPDWHDIFSRELRCFKGWLARQPWPVLLVNYRDLVQASEHGSQHRSEQIVTDIQQFLQQPLDLQAMMTPIDPELYRNRTC